VSGTKKKISASDEEKEISRNFLDIFLGRRVIKKVSGDPFALRFDPDLGVEGGPACILGAQRRLKPLLLEARVRSSGGVSGTTHPGNSTKPVASCEKFWRVR
jgi:hypothetical protein